MSAEAAALVRSWRVGRYTVELTMQKPKPGAVVMCSAVWSPTEPSSLSTAEWAQYRQGRHKAISELAEELGLSIAVLEL